MGQTANRWIGIYSSSLFLSAFRVWIKLAASEARSKILFRTRASTKFSFSTWTEIDGSLFWFFLPSIFSSFFHAFIPSFFHTYLPSFFYTLISAFFHSFLSANVHSFIQLVLKSLWLELHTLRGWRSDRHWGLYILRAKTEGASKRGHLNRTFDFYTAGNLPVLIIFLFWANYNYVQKNHQNGNQLLQESACLRQVQTCPSTTSASTHHKAGLCDQL